MKLTRKKKVNTEFDEILHEFNSNNKLIQFFYIKCETFRLIIVSQMIAKLSILLNSHNQFSSSTVIITNERMQITNCNWTGSLRASENKFNSLFDFRWINYYLITLINFFSVLLKNFHVPLVFFFHIFQRISFQSWIC